MSYSPHCTSSLESQSPLELLTAHIGQSVFHPAFTGRPAVCQELYWALQCGVVNESAATQTSFSGLFLEIQEDLLFLGMRSGEGFRLAKAS